MYIFKKTHIKSRIYKTDQCSSDLFHAKEFLEAITLSGTTCELMMNQKFDSRTPLKLELQSHLVGEIFIKIFLLFRSPTIVKNKADSYIIREAGIKCEC